MKLQEIVALIDVAHIVVAGAEHLQRLGVLFHRNQYKVAQHLLHIAQLALLKAADDLVDVLVGALNLQFSLEELGISGGLRDWSIVAESKLSLFLSYIVC